MKIGLVVPEVRLTGGIQKHAEFVLEVLTSIPQAEVEIASLAMSSRDRSSVRLFSYQSWKHGVRQEAVHLGGRSATHFGCFLSELETQRFSKRADLTAFVQRQDLVAVVAGAPSWSLPVTGLGVPVVLTFATLTSLERAPEVPWTWSIRKAVRNLITRRVAALDDLGLQASDEVVVENRIMFDYAVKKRGSVAGVTYAPPGVDTELFRPLEVRTFDNPFYLFVGRMRDPRKNFGMLIDAYRQLLKRMPEAPRLVLAGTEPPDPRALENIPVEKLELVLQPSDSHLADLYRGATASILTSDEEGLGFVVIEAMASGVPVVSTRCGGPEEIITHSEDGFLVDRGDVIALCKYLEQLANDRDLNLAIGKQARRSAVSNFSLSSTRHHHRSIYEALLDNPNSQRKEFS